MSSIQLGLGLHALRILPPHPGLRPGLKNAEYKAGRCPDAPVLRIHEAGRSPDAEDDEEEEEDAGALGRVAIGKEKW